MLLCGQYFVPIVGSCFACLTFHGRCSFRSKKGKERNRYFLACANPGRHRPGREPLDTTPSGAFIARDSLLTTLLGERPQPANSSPIGVLVTCLRSVPLAFAVKMPM